VKFLVDMPVTPRAGAHLRAARHDAVHASEVDLSTASDLEIVKAARAQERIIVTADLDYPRLLALQQAEGPGIILFRGGTYSDVEMLALLDRVLSHSEVSDLETSITVVDQGRVRRRRLPI